MNKIKNFMKTEPAEHLLASLLAVVFGLLFGFVVILAIKPSVVFEAFSIILQGGFFDGLRGVGNVLFNAIPIILTGLSVGFAFKTGLFNIGVTGQFTVGAFTAIYIGVNWSFLPPSIGWIVGIVGGMLAGALWGLVVGALKAYRNVNEVISSIMMNYIAVYLVNYFLINSAFDAQYSRSLPPQYAYLPRLGFDKIFPNSSLNIGIIIAILVAVILYIVLNKTKFGFELKAVGYNRHASRYTGINEKRSIIFSMVIAGAVAGLGGALMYLSDVGIYLTTIYSLLGEGFEGIAVALLGQNNPIGIIFSGLFISHIKYGGGNLQLFRLEPEIIQVITSAIIYISALTVFLKQIFKRIKKRSGGAE